MEQRAHALGVGPCCKHFIRPKEVQEVMLHTGPFGKWQFGGANIQALVELQRVAIHDLPAEIQGEPDGKVTFS